MIRRMVLTLLLAMPMSVLALGLGDIDVRSGLNQPFEAEIPLLSVASDEIDTLNVGLASPEAFEQAGIERPFHLTQLRFKVEQKGSKPYIRAYSQEPIKEPYLQYLLEVNWRGGRLVKEFTALLDPPTLAEVAPPPIQAPKAAPAKPAETPATQAGEPVKESASVSSVSSSPAVTQPAIDTTTGYTVHPGETLWSIAQRLRLDSTVSAQQIMLAILKKNPDAFLNNNVNSLKAHAILTIPDFDAIIALSRDEARGIVKKHNAEWKNSEQKTAVAKAKPAEPQTKPVPQQQAEAKLKLVAPTEEIKPAATGTPAAASPSSPPATTNTPPSPTTTPPSTATSTPPGTIATPNAAAATDTAAMQAAELDKAHKELTLANEAVEARRQENGELRSRLAALEEQTASAQRLIKLKDEELASLQTKIKEIEHSQQSSTTPAAAANAGSGAAKPQSATDAAESSLQAMWSALLSNPLGQGMVAVVGLLLVSMLWLIKRRHEANTLVAEEGGETVAPVTHSAGPAQTSIAESPPPAGAAPALGETDPLEEADAYIRHQRYVQAEAVLKQAIANNPDRHEIQLKLLDIYFRTKDVEAFTSQARELHDSLHGHSGPLWDKVVAMGKELDPNEPLFGGQTPVVTSVAGATRLAANEVLETPPSIPAMETGDSWPDRERTGNVIEFDQASLTPSAMEQAAPAQPEPNLLEGLSANAEVNPPQPFDPLRPSSGQASTGSFDNAQDRGLDYPLDLDLKKEAERLADDGIESVPLPEADRFSALESGELTAEDEVATKLELARAYMDMGDPDGAQGILDEVMKEGNESQRREAEELLRKIG